MERITAERAIKTGTNTRRERSGKVGWFMSKTYTASSPPHEGEPAGTVETKQKIYIYIYTYILLSLIHI